VKINIIIDINKIAIILVINIEIVKLVINLYSGEFLFFRELKTFQKLSVGIISSMYFEATQLFIK